MTIKIGDYDDHYVQEILAALPKGLTRSQFNGRCQRDINGGYINEVQEAYWRYFKPAELTTGKRE